MGHIDNWDDYFLGVAYYISLKSKDRSTKVGCVIVGESKHVLTTGYNGFPRGVDDKRGELHERPTKYLWTEQNQDGRLVA